ncbi:MAG TPA: cell division protein ZapA [Bacillota bacterium]|nr:cell division protein ZapA [Bacillota bacterium]
MLKQESRVEVEIFGEYYTLKGDCPPENMISLAQYVSRRMKQLAGRNPRLTKAQTAVLAALNIAEELKRLQAEYDELIRMLEPDKSNNKKSS